MPGSGHRNTFGSLAVDRLGTFSPYCHFLTMMTTMIARLRAFRGPLLRTVAWTTICAFVSVAQLLNAAACCLLHYFRPNPWAYSSEAAIQSRSATPTSVVFCFGDLCLFIYFSQRQAFHNHVTCDFCFGFKWFSILRQIFSFLLCPTYDNKIGKIVLFFKGTMLVGSWLLWFFLLTILLSIDLLWHWKISSAAQEIETHQQQ